MPALITSCHEIVQLVTGINRLNYYLQRFGIVDSAICSCDNDIENIPHFLFYCENYKDIRLDLKRTCLSLNLKWPPNAYEIVEHQMLLKATINFIKTSKRFEF